MKINKKEKYGKQILKNILTKENIIFFILWLIGTYIFFQYDMVFLTDGKYYYFDQLKF